MISRWELVVLAICIVNVSVKAEWKDNLLNKENGHRGDHGVEPLTLSSELSAVAQKHADKLAKSCGSGHSDKKGRQYHGGVPGENIHYALYSDPSDIKDPEEDAVGAADNWYSEIEKYPWAKPPTKTIEGMGIGHFTQQVWKASKEVGYGLSYGKKDGCATVYVVANYFPAGNMGGGYKSNVLPKKA